MVRLPDFSKKMLLRLGRWLRLVKCLLHKHKDLSSEPQHPLKSWVWCVGVAIARAQGGSESSTDLKLIGWPA